MKDEPTEPSPPGAVADTPRGAEAPAAGGPDTGGPDTDTRDAAAPGAGGLDANAGDAATPNAGGPDAHTRKAAAPRDASRPSADTQDSAAPDADGLAASAPDAKARDTAAPDADRLHASAPDADTQDTAAPGAGGPTAGSPEHGVRTPAPPGGAARVGGPEEGAARRLTRASADRKVLAGVCAGAGRYFGVDPVIFRIVLAVLSLTGGIGLIIYGMGWLVVPQEGERESEAHRLLSGRIEGASLTAVLVALVGCGLYASMLGNAANQAFSFILLAATAGAVYWSGARRRIAAAGEAPVAATAVVDAPPAVKAPPEPGGPPSWWRDPLTKDPLTKEPAYLWGPDDGPDDDPHDPYHAPYHDPHHSPYGAADRTARQQQQRKAPARRERSWLFGLTVFLLAVTAAGVGTGVSWPYQPLGPSLEIGLASALGVFGTAFVTASFAGRARGGTLFFSLVTIAALIGTATLPRHGHGMGGVTWRPADTSAVRESYDLGAGHGTLDLTALPLNGGTVTTRLEVVVGEAEIRLPANATVRLDYDLGFGEAALPDRAGHRVEVGRDGRVVYAPPPGTPQGGTINLRVVLGVGQVTVVR